MDYFINGNTLEITLKGNYLSYNNDREKELLFKQIEKSFINKILINANQLEKWDSTLVVILFNIIKISKEKNIEINLDSLPNNLNRLLKLAFSVDRKPNKKLELEESFLERVGSKTIDCYESFKIGFLFLIESLRSIRKFFFSSVVMRKVDFLFALEECGYKALPIVALISFMVGLILAFVGAVQLKVFSAEIYVASLVAIAMVRIMGAVMTGIIMSGRTGASYAATIGSMQVNEEIDALKTMGIPIVDFLLLPRILALTITMPFLTIFADIMGMLGGGFVGIFMLNIAPQEYLKMSFNVLNIRHFLIGVFHGYVFGCIIAICGCYYGINCGKDADSVGKSTTQSVVSSIIWIVIATGIITLICNIIGI